MAHSVFVLKGAPLTKQLWLSANLVISYTHIKGLLLLVWILLIHLFLLIVDTLEGILLCEVLKKIKFIKPGVQKYPIIKRRNNLNKPSQSSKCIVGTYTQPTPITPVK